MWEQRLGNHTPTAVPSGTLPPWLTLPTRPALSNNMKCNKEGFIYNRQLPSYTYWKLYLISTYTVFVQISGCEEININMLFVFVLPNLSAKYQWHVSTVKSGMWYTLICFGLCYSERYHFYNKSQLVLWTLFHHIGFPMNKTFKTQPPKVNCKEWWAYCVLLW